ncbi:MAG: LTA synthase family protein [Cytophagales bacterium]|nr:LTA synthase family protein [Cytophagales bacterium]
MLFKPSNPEKPIHAYLQCVATGITLTALLVLIRFKVLGFPILATLLSTRLPKRLLTGYHDALYALGLTLFFGALLLLLPGKRKLVNRIFKGVAVVSLLCALINIQMVRMLGAPFNYQWFYYSDLLNSNDSFKASLAGFSVAQILKGMLLALALCAALVGGATLLARLGSRLNFRLVRWVPVVVLAGWALYLPLARHYVHKQGYNPHKLANPITTFVGSVASTLVYAPDLYTRNVPAHLNEFLPENQPVTSKATARFVDSPSGARVRNVLFFILESVPAEYVGNPKYTPELAKYLPEGSTFSNIYAHCPSTNNSLAAILTGSYPWISYKSITHEYPALQVPSVSHELKKRGYRTAFMHTSDNRFNRMDEFLGYRGFDIVEDLHSIRCTNKEQFKFDEDMRLNGVNDECLVESFTSWLGKSDTTKPFFGMLWTSQTHYPYFLSKPEENLGVKDRYQNRYLNAVRHSDAVLGNLLADLKKKGLYESTLVVVVGDHGEAFDDHDQYGHGNAIYEENVHVPLVLINSRLFKGATYPTIGGHIDLAPTVMDVLGLPAPAEWEGNSLFAAARKERTYFFAPWTDFKFGYREGKYKIIYNATLNTIEVFNLELDPQEHKNLAGEMPELVEQGYDRLAAWVQHQDKHFKATLAKSGLQP